MLRVAAEYGAGVNDVAPSHGERTEQICPGPDHAVIAESDVAFQHRVGADLDVPSELDVAGQDGGGMNASGSFGSHASTPFLGAILATVPCGRMSGRSSIRHRPIPKPEHFLRGNRLGKQGNRDNGESAIYRRRVCRDCLGSLGVLFGKMCGWG